MNFKSWTLTIACWLVGAAVGVLLMWAVPAAIDWLAVPLSNEQVFARELVRLAISVACALSLGHWARRRLLGTERKAAPGGLARHRTATLVLVAALYSVTWAFGVPAVITRLTEGTINSYKAECTGKDHLWWENYPYICVRFGAPVLPGVVVVYYENQLGGQWGGGGWHVVAWWGVGQRELFRSTTWLS